MDVTKTAYWRRRYHYLRDEQSQYRVHWKEIVDWLLPRAGRYLDTDQGINIQQEGKKKHQKIVNGIPSQALMTMAGGLQGGLTSPSRPWMTLELEDEVLSEFKPVRMWLHDVRNIILAVLARSNFYDAIHYTYVELGAFGTACMMIEEDLTSVIRCRPMTIGEYVLALDSNYRPCAMMRKFSMTAEQMVEKFGKDKCPEAVLRCYEDKKNVDQRFDIIHVVERNERYNENRALSVENKSYQSIYFPQSGGDEDLILKKSGYNSIPFIASRWSVFGVDTYGSSPAMEALGDIKMLQKMEEKKLMALDKQVNPPMNASVALKNQGATTVAGGVNWVDPIQGQQAFTPAYLVNPNIQQIGIEIDRIERRIGGFFYNPLFLATLQTERQMTAFEIAKRHEEKLMLLGPIIERQQSEALNPIIDRVFSILMGLNVLPPVPKEILGMPLKVVFNGLLAQAQKMVTIAPIEQLVGFTANIANAKAISGQAGVHKLDFDEAIDQYSSALGTPPGIIRSDDEVAAINEQQARDAAAKNMAAMAQPGAKAAKDLSETNLGNGDVSALDALLGAVGSPNAGQGR